MIYSYKITFSGTSFYYIGIHKGELDDDYVGSPTSNKWVWDRYTPLKTVLQTFDSWEDARRAETALLTLVFNSDICCLNEHCGTHPSLEACSRGGKNSPVGLNQISYQERSRANRSRKNQLLLCSNAGKAGGKRAVETGQLASARRKSHEGHLQAKRRGRAIVVTTPDGRNLYFKSFREASEETGLNRQRLADVAKGIHQDFKGHKVSYK